VADFTLQKTERNRPKKPHRDFPVFPHRNGQWAKKIRQKVHYFGRWADDPKGARGLDLWREHKDDLLAGRGPRTKTDGLVVSELCNKFLADQEALRDNDELSSRTFLTYYRTCEEVVNAFGRNRLVSDLTPDDFRKLRAKLARTRGLVALRNAIQRVRSLLKFGFNEVLLLAPIRYGQAFAKPKMDRIDAPREAHRAEHGPQMFEAAAIRLMLDVLEGKQVTIGTNEETGELVKVTLNRMGGLRAMVLLAANCAFGQSDLANLPIRAVNLEAGWIAYGRSKSGLHRKIPLWMETVAAIRAWLPQRPKAKEPADASLLFLTCRGARFLRLNESGYHIDGIGQEFQKLIRRLELKRTRLGVYSLRHSFETVAGETGDQVAVDAVMGHKDGAMAAHYRERISDERFVAVTKYVHSWLFPNTKRK
jgi:integrase